LKSIYTANLIPIVVEPIVDGDELKTDVKAIESIINDTKYAG